MFSCYLIWQTFEELAWQTFEEVALQKMKPNEDANTYIYTPSSSLFIHFSRNDMLPTVSVLLVKSLVR